jgi:hypothetical protein
VIVGAIVAGVPYALGIVFSGGAGFPNHTYWLLVPGVGPWLVLATRDKSCPTETICSGSTCTTTTTSCQDNAVDQVAKTFLILDGLMQTTGVALLIWGIASPSTKLVREDVASVSIVPAVGPGFYGVAAMGRF